MAKHYKLVVIGAGTAAMVAATRVRAAGWSVAIIDSRPFGGTCALRGCDPKKMLVGAAQAVDHVRRMQPNGLTGDVEIDWPRLMAFKRSFTDPVPEKHARRYAEKGIDTYRGAARFTSPTSLEVEGEQLQADRFLIASGAEPATLGIEGERHLVTNEGFLDLGELPKRIVLVGGGYIAAEFSHIAARAGSKVTILQHGERMLTPFEPELVDWLMEKYTDLGVEVRTGTNVNAIEQDGGIYRVLASEGERELAVEADLVVHAAGRVPALAALDLDAAGIAHDRGRLSLNEFLQSTSNQAVYAAGDAAQKGPPLTPVSSHDAKVVAANLLEGNHAMPNYSGVPSVAFTIPPLASVGLTEAQAASKGLGFKVNSQRASDWYTARQSAEPIYGYKVVVDEQGVHVLGAHLVGPHADEVINVFTLAIRHGLTIDQLKTTMFAYPTGASDIGYMLG